ncbi:MAG: hypothetical protein P8R54_26020 [Myxococcota bacterium]|nr:hypothetical protein [Myxococcota bacterium]
MVPSLVFERVKSLLEMIAVAVSSFTIGRDEEDAFSPRTILLSA